MNRTKKIEIPAILPVSPLSLACPHCGAKRNRDCATSSGGVAVLHLERIQAAAAADERNERIRENMKRAVERIVRETAEAKEGWVSARGGLAGGS